MALLPKIVTVLVVVIAVTIAYFAYTVDVHPDIEQPGVYRLRYTGLGLSVKLLELFAWFSGGDSYEMLIMKGGRQVDKYPPKRRKMPKPESGLQESMEYMAGIPVLVTRKIKTKKPLSPAIVYSHGGAFALGSIYSYDGLTRRIVDMTEAVVFNVDYRLSKTAPSPAQLNDCHDVAMELYMTAEKWGVDKTKIFTAGDSAGGTLAAALPLRLRDEESPLKLAGQILLYPWLQIIDWKLPSHIEHYCEYQTELVSKLALRYLNANESLNHLLTSNNHVSAPVLKKYSDLVSPNLLPKSMLPTDYKQERKEIADPPISKEFETAMVDPYNFPLMEEDLTDLPPTFMLSLQLDALRDENYIYVRRLKDAGNDVTHFHEKHSWHGYLCFMKPPMDLIAAHRATDAIAGFINDKL